jgi:hypothetical protein
LAASAVGVALVTFRDGTGPHRSPSSIEPKPDDAREVQQASPIETAQSDATVVLPTRLSGGNHNPTVTEDASDAGLTDGDNASETVFPGDIAAPELKPVREKVIRDTDRIYSLLFTHLGLTAQEKDALLAFLVEVQLAGTDATYRRDGTIYRHRGEKMDPDERANRIAVIIGDAKLEQFLTLERSLASYSEAGSIAALLKTRGAPVNDTQRDGLFRVLVETRDQYLTTTPLSDLETKSLEHLEQLLTQINEYERHVMELAPSVLSADQVVYLHERYQYMAYRRADALELQRKQRANGTIAGDSLWWYPTWGD